ncbi:MAG TPA: CHAT domain-containing protein [Gemmatimonadaceae bacterium]|nr:CHAT domain-containing protein [Gemmatimonadaceae bacterium]
MLVLTLAIQLPAADSLRAQALRLSESALVAETKAAPLPAREAVSEAVRQGDLAVARRLAAAYALAWQDSFLVRDVARFAAWPPERRAARLWADSVRRAGTAAYASDGGHAAIALWRRALARAQSIGDTALSGAVTGNIGAGFLREGMPDSAETHLAGAVTLARAVGDRRVEANALSALAMVSEDRGNMAAARERHSRALELYERMGDTRGIALVRNNLGLLAWATGDLGGARRQFEAALVINRRDGRDEVAATNLVNIAGLASLEGDFARAQRLYRDALATWRTREQWADAADALHGLGQLELRRGDYVAARAALTEALATYERTGPLANELAVRRALAGAFAAQGELQHALDELRTAEDLVDAQGVEPGVRAGIVLARADIAIQLNAYAEAERLYLRAQRLYREAGDLDGEAEAQHGTGLLFLERDDYSRAQTMFEAALRTQEAGGDQRAGGLTRLALGQVARARGDTALARQLLNQAVAELERAGDPVAVAAALGERGAVDLERGLPKSAEALYRQALARIDDRVAPDVAWRLYAGLAHARRAQGAEADAAHFLRAALAEVERAGRSLALPERRAGFLADKWDAYAQLALMERARGLPGAAFEVSERLRAREMLDLLERGRIGVPTGAAAELVMREQDLRRRITELTRELRGVAVGTLRGPAMTVEGGVIREALLGAQDAYADLLLELRERAPRHSALVSRQTAGWREVARRLGADEALIEYLVSDSGSVAFVVQRDSLAVVDLEISRRDLARLAAFARGTVESPRPGSDSLWRGPFRRLHRHLIAPIEATGLLAGTSRLVLVPHAELHYLPFAALLGDRGLLVEQYEITTTPSATVWLALGDRPAQSTGAGVLAVAPRPDALPGSRREVQAVARLAGADAQVLIGGRATEAAFLGTAPGKRILHLATYGVLNKHNPLFSFVEFAPDGGQDGRLEVHEVFGLELAADLVVLSACQTGLGSGRLADVPTGDDWVGLTRAFLHAGAANVVSTLWAVEDQATAALMEEFYKEHAAGSDPGRALARAQRAVLRVPGAAHPFHWAGVVVVGGAP